MGRAAHAVRPSSKYRVMTTFIINLTGVVLIILIVVWFRLTKPGR